MNNKIPSPLTQRRFSDKELAIMRSTYANNDDLLKLLRKIFKPEYDYNAPLGQTRDMLWVGLDQLAQMNPQDREVVILTQIRMNNWLEHCLMELSFLANEKVETKAEEEERNRKNSVR